MSFYFAYTRIVLLRIALTPRLWHLPSPKAQAPDPLCNDLRPWQRFHPCPGPRLRSGLVPALSPTQGPGLVPALHCSSEVKVMHKRNDKHHARADVGRIPKMCFLSKSVDGLFQKTHFCFQARNFSLTAQLSPPINRRHVFSSLT